MGYLPQFKNDLFISYRRVSNEDPDKWVDVFLAELERSLKEMVGSIKIWRDSDQLRTGERWRPDIAQALDDTAIFLAIISRTYFDSDECLKEMDHFLKGLKDSAGGIERKIVPIFKQPPKPEQELPHEIGEIHHYDFYRPGPTGSIQFREFSPTLDGQDKQNFWETFHRVAQDIMEMLEKLNGCARQRVLGKVFIALVCPELQEERERLRADFQQRGYLVVPEHEYLWNADDYRDKITRDLEDALLCIHLVSGMASIEPTSASHARLQLELAHEAMKLKKRPSPMVWIQPTGEVHESARELLDFIKNDLANEGVEYSQGGFEDFKTQIYDKLTPLQPRSAPVLARKIALLVEEEDVSELGDIKTLLVEKLSLEPKPLKFNGTSPKDVARLAHTLADTKQCLIFWGKQNEEWVIDLLDHEALAGSLGKDRMCVYAAGPVTAEKKAFHTTKALTILPADDLGEQALRTFFAAGVIAS